MSAGPDQTPRRGARTPPDVRDPRPRADAPDPAREIADLVAEAREGFLDVLAEAARRHGAFGKLEGWLRSATDSYERKKAELDSVRGRLEKSEEDKLILESKLSVQADEIGRLRDELRQAREEIHFLERRPERASGARTETAREERGGDSHLSPTASLGETARMSKERRATTPRTRTAGAPPAKGGPAKRGTPRAKLVEPAPPAESVPPAGAALSEAPPVAATSPGSVEVVYRAWCHEAGGLASRADLFAEKVRVALPDAEVRVLYRDADAHTRPIVFTQHAEGTSAVAYWALLSAERSVLVPVPMGRFQFRELAPVFEGSATPASLVAVRPAPLRRQGDTFALLASGEVR